MFEGGLSFPESGGLSFPELGGLSFLGLSFPELGGLSFLVKLGDCHCRQFDTRRDFLSIKYFIILEIYKCQSVDLFS